MEYKRVGVLLGGMSAEREVSLASGKAVAAGLERSGFDVVEIDADRELDKKLRAADVEAVFIALHGRLGEDGSVQGMLEVMRIPYTGSSVAASAAAMDKQRTRDLLAAAGLPVARGWVLGPDAPRVRPHECSLPLVIKPVTEGSSVGVSIAKTEDGLEKGLVKAFDCCSRVLIEEFIEGVEIQVAVLDGEPLGTIEIAPNREFYDYEAKYQEGGAVHHIPPRISDALNETCLKLGRSAYAAIGCSGLARIDLIAPSTQSPVILEVNTIPGMTDLSLAPEIAAHAGISFDALVARLMNSATLHIKERNA